jgi:putative Mg2+ transporter-C (MgtC) family protein
MENILDITTLDMLLRLLVAMGLGMVIGIESVWAHKTAGLRTFALVSMGSALFVIVSGQMVAYYTGYSGLNPLIMIGQIIVGIGFIGTGVVFAKDSKLMGLTTAASLWVSAGIGISAGFGLFRLAIIATFLTLFIFVVLWFFESTLKKSKFYKEDNFDQNSY